MNKYVSPLAEVIVFSVTDTILSSPTVTRPGDVDDDYDAAAKAITPGYTPV